MSSGSAAQRSDLTPSVPLAFSHPALHSGTWPLHSAVAVKGSRAHFGWPWDEHSRDPKAHQGTGTSCSCMRQDQFCWCTCPAAKEPSYFTSSQMLRASFYFFIYYILQVRLSVSILLTYLCLLSKTFFIGNNFHFQASSRLETQNYLSKSDSCSKNQIS